MRRTQIYLSERETEALDRAAKATGLTRSHLIREAIAERTEVLVGMRDGEEEATTRALDLLQWLEVNVALADAAGKIGRRYLRCIRAWARSTTRSRPPSSDWARDC